MTRYVERNYGADADGNRGRDLIEYELEASDAGDVKEQIVEQLKDLYDSDMLDEIPETVDITLIDYVTDYDVTFTVYVKDYFTIGQLNKLLKDNQ